MQADYGGATLHVAIERYEVEGTVLVIETNNIHPEDPWAGSDVDPIEPITPSMIRAWIIEAKNLGWDATKKGAQFLSEVVDGEFGLARRSR